MMKKLGLLFLIMSLSTVSMGQNIQNDQQLQKYLDDYAKESAKYQICGEYDRVDIANIGIYFDEILSPTYLKQQVKKYGSVEKAGMNAVKKAEVLSKKYQYDLVKKGIPNGMCAELLQDDSEEY